MPFGAHETMEVHEVLSEKINAINHFNLYAAQAKNPLLKEMITRHQQEELRTYDEIVAYTHDYTQFSPVPPNTNTQGVRPRQIQYGVHDQAMFAPEANASFNDFEIATAMLLAHKNAAANGVKACMECADPNLRQMIFNSVGNCVNQSYEIFLFMNEQGLYQVPEIENEAAKTFLHSYQPISESLKAQYGEQAGQFQGQDQPQMGNLQYQPATQSGLASSTFTNNPSSHVINAAGQMGTSSPMMSQGQMQAGANQMINQQHTTGGPRINH
ncbi:spore coat protein [Mesobacillus harenae]|uniref:spore coat protein n=1 Tax=Mesobacillus harenae TaxID=2213203 RepID=UPI001580FAD0|nr:spore coat protein [Mesobacillus harenae]